jgi:heme/copper-type cytochrome/quinol oxidase subunit 2
MPIRKVTPMSGTGSVHPEHESIKKEENNNGIAALVVVIIIAVLAAAGCVFMYLKYSSAQNKIKTLTDPQVQQEMAKKEAQTLVAKIGKLIMLPADEEPTIATVTDVDALKKEQPFYRDAQNGDKVIIYMQAKKAIIYNEARDILVNVGPIFLNEDSNSTTDNATSTN